MSKICVLPKELLLLIFSFVDSQKTLSSLSQACKAFHKITEAILYESVKLTGRTAPCFETTVSRMARHKSLVKALHIDCHGDDSTSPCSYAPLYAELPNLEVLSLYGGYWHFDDTQSQKSDDETVVLWETDQDKLVSFFEQAGLDKNIDERIWPKLRSVTLDFYELNAQGWYCQFEPAVFLIASLEDLTLRGCRFTDDDGKDLLTSPHRGQTALRKLVLERSYIHQTAIFNFLSAPKALTHLSLQHNHDLWHHEAGHQPTTSKRAREYMDAFSQQKHSLQYLHMNDALALWIDNEAGKGAFDFTAFPELNEIQCDGEYWTFENEKYLRLKSDEERRRSRHLLEQRFEWSARMGIVPGLRDCTLSL